MKYVYILQSLSHPDKYYTGVTDNVEKRLELHNSGEAQFHHTKIYGPWKLIAQTGFAEESKAHAFERYLKSGSGRAFAKRHF